MLSVEDVKSGIAELEPVSRDSYYRGNSQESFWQTAGLSEAYGELVGEIKQEGERLMELPIPELTYGLFSLYEKQGSRLEFESVYFERRRRLNTFMLLTLLEPGREDYAALLHETVWAICNEYTWCLPAHVSNEKVRGTIDLFAAETGFTLSEMLLLLGDRLPAMLRVRITEEVEERLFKPYLAGGPFGWETATHNWSAVCAGSIGAAALIMLEPSERLTAIVAKSLGSMAYYLEGFGEDGACLEGVGYWNYGFGYFVYYADLLKRRTKGRINLFDDPKVRQIALFQQKCYLHGDATVNFSDSQPHAPVQLGLSHYLADVYPEMELPPSFIRAAYTGDHCSRWAPAFRNIVWYDPQKRAADWRPADYYLPDAQWLVSRYASGLGSFGLAAKGGSNDEPHNHNDISGFILLADGAALVAELGAGEYTADYFGEGRYGYDCNGSQGHSVPIVDGVHQAAGSGCRAKVLEAELGEEAVRFRLELKDAYPVPHLTSLVRELAWSKNELPSLRLTDEFAFAAVPGSVIERLITTSPPLAADAPHGVIVLRGEGSRLAAKISFDPGQLKPVVTKRSYSNHYGVETPWYTVDFELREPSLINRVVIDFDMILTDGE